MLTRFDPFTDFSRLSSELFFDREPAPARPPSFVPAVDIQDDKDALVFRVEIPGLKAEEVHIAVEKNVLTLRGERKLEKKEGEGGYHRVERAYGTFARSFVLPETADAEKIEANLEDGVLTLRVGKRPPEQPRRIAVKAS